jgi:hypothetical protein
MFSVVYNFTFLIRNIFALSFYEILYSLPSRDTCITGVTVSLVQSSMYLKLHLAWPIVSSHRLCIQDRSLVPISVKFPGGSSPYLSTREIVVRGYRNTVGLSLPGRMQSFVNL